MSCGDPHVFVTRFSEKDKNKVFPYFDASVWEVEGEDNPMNPVESRLNVCPEPNLNDNLSVYCCLTGKSVANAERHTEFICPWKQFIDAIRTAMSVGLSSRVDTESVVMLDEPEPVQVNLWTFNDVLKLVASVEPNKSFDERSYGCHDQFANLFFACEYSIFDFDLRIE